ncbi:recombinase family protein [Leisingera sp. D0M16]|uniref:recombinase family protein n=1 Tax=Leisingera coralii TaxID=3351347 RepID=UPI003B786AA3
MFPVLCRYNWGRNRGSFAQICELEKRRARALSWPNDDRNRDRRLKTAAQYVRMSTEHQRYSTENQSDAIARYADERGYQIVRTYSDAGKSGLRIEGRTGLTRLIEDIEAGQANSRTVLVYDVSRWGRFQDADESAYYEYMSLPQRSGPPL